MSSTIPEPVALKNTRYFQSHLCLAYEYSQKLIMCWAKMLAPTNFRKLGSHRIYIFSDHNTFKLKVSNKKITRKTPYT